MTSVLINGAFRNGINHDDEIVQCREFESLLLGRELGRGATRAVYTSALEPDKYVIKWEFGSSYQNIVEFETWERLCLARHPVRKWFAPCHILSRHGRLLVQSKCAPLPDDFKWPRKMPRCFTDIKWHNFGIFEDRLVCLDYGTALANVLDNTNLIPTRHKEEPTFAKST